MKIIGSNTLAILVEQLTDPHSSLRHIILALATHTLLGRNVHHVQGPSGAGKSFGIMLVALFTGLEDLGGIHPEGD